MLRWPNTRQNESTVIKEFKLLIDQLTKESALELCSSAPGCGFLYELYDAGNLSYECAFQCYLTLLRAIAKLVPRSTFNRMFPKGCSGCAMLQILSILCLHPILENDVNMLFRELLYDKHGDILNCDDIRRIAMMMRGAYTEPLNPFPNIGYCTHYDSENEGFKLAYFIGVLFSSDEFCELMKTNPTLGSQIAHEMLKNPGNTTWQSNKLHESLSKYKELTSDNKSHV